MLIFRLIWHVAICIFLKSIDTVIHKFKSDDAKFEQSSYKFLPNRWRFRQICVEFDFVLFECTSDVITINGMIYLIYIDFCCIAMDMQYSINIASNYPH